MSTLPPADSPPAAGSGYRLGGPTSAYAQRAPAEAAAERALRERPSLSIRRRLSAGFLLCFSLSAAVSVAWLLTIARVKTKLQFMVVADSYTFEIQQARRFEKNYFLYGTNLADAREHVRIARGMLSASSDKLEAVIGRKSFSTMLSHLDRYDALLTSLQTIEERRRLGLAVDRSPIESELRQHGAEMVTVAQELVARERESVDSMLRLAGRLPVVFLVLLFVLMIYVVTFLNRQILRRLNRLMDATRRIAGGDFTPIGPRGKYRDEFSELVMALNNMMHQLVQRQEMLLHSHKLQAVGTLTAGIAHELNNPINNITLTAGLLKEDYRELSDAERLDMIEDLVTQADRSRRIVRNLLDFARESEMRAEHINLIQLIDDTLKLATNQVKLARVRVEQEIPDALPPTYGDRQQLIQVFLNLVLNAIDAMPNGGTLRVSAGKSDESGLVEVKVQDSGTGIPDHVLPKIFDPFFTTKPMNQGTGLGLSVSLGIVRHHGGDIRVVSELGKGSCFTVLLPVARIPAPIPAAPM